MTSSLISDELVPIGVSVDGRQLTVSFNGGLQPASTPQIDAHTRDGRSVQVKLKGASGRSFGMRWSSKRKRDHAEMLIGLKPHQRVFTEIYNCPFPVDLLERRPDTSNGQISAPISKLLAQNPKPLKPVTNFKSINRWFAPILSDVA